MNDIDLLVICCEGLDPLQALDLIRWNFGRDASNLPDIEEFKRHIFHPSMKWWVKANANKVARAMTAENKRCREA